MLAVKGFYDGRTVKLSQDVPAKYKPEVLVIFEEVELAAIEKENSQAERREAFQREPVIEPASAEEIAMIDERMQAYYADPASFISLESIK